MTPTRLAAIDLDGTLLSSKRTISERSLAALRAWTDAGHIVVLVTARPPRTIRAVSAGIKGIAICSNGAALYDLDADNFTVVNPLPENNIRSLIEIMERLVPGIVFSVDYGSHVVQDPAFPSKDVRDGGVMFADVLPLQALPVAKLKAYHADIGSQQLWERLAPAVGHLAEATLSGAPFVEFSMVGVNKATALAKLATDLNVEHQHVIAFGDMPNDIPMLDWAGTGVAMANAHVDVLAAADEVTSSNDDDGVAAVLERRLLLGINVDGCQPPPTFYIQKDSRYVAGLFRRELFGDAAAPSTYEATFVAAYAVFLERLASAVDRAYRSGGEQVKVEVIDAEAIAERLLSIGQTTNAITLHPLVNLPGREFGISRLYRPHGMVPIGETERPGSPPMRDQLRALREITGGKPVTVIDDDCTSGRTLRQTLGHLRSAGIDVERVVVGVDALSSRQREQIAKWVPMFESLRHLRREPGGRLVDARNFVLGADGLVVQLPGNQRGRIPYFWPFASASARVGIPGSSERQFSLDILAANAELFFTLGKYGYVPSLRSAQSGTRHFLHQWFRSDASQTLFEVSQQLTNAVVSGQYFPKHITAPSFETPERRLSA